MLPQLDAEQVRVLGALIEKEATTPEYYPMSANALVNACNQKNNRSPVVNYDEETVLEAIARLRADRMAAVITGSGRVNKYAQRFSELYNLGRREMALLCILFLRGPQTLGELRDRSERIHNFEDLEAVEATLDRLANHETGTMVARLAKIPGQKEARYAHLFSGEPVQDALPQAAEERAPAAPGRLEALENEVATLRAELAGLKQKFEDFERQFS